MQILEHQTLHLTNLLSIRRNVPQSQVPLMIEHLAKHLQSNGATKTGPLVTATFNADPSTNMMDMAFYIPISKEIPSSGDLVFKPHLYLANCIMSNYKGNPQNVNVVMEQMNQFIANNHLTPITSCFIVNRNEVNKQEDMDKYEVDVYISISPNIV